MYFSLIKSKYTFIHIGLTTVLKKHWLNKHLHSMLYYGCLITNHYIFTHVCLIFWTTSHTKHFNEHWLICIRNHIWFLWWNIILTQNQQLFGKEILKSFIFHQGRCSSLGERTLYQMKIFKACAWNICNFWYMIVKYIKIS